MSEYEVVTQIDALVTVVADSEKQARETAYHMVSASFIAEVSIKVIDILNVNKIDDVCNPLPKGEEMACSSEDKIIMTAEEWNTRNPIGTRVSWVKKGFRYYKDGSISISLKEFSRCTIGPAVMASTGLKVPVQFEGKKRLVAVS